MPQIHQIISLPQNEKTEVSITSEKHHYGLYEMMGRRKEQEDAAFACWYDSKHFDTLSPEDIGCRLWTTYHLINSIGSGTYEGGTTASTTVYDGKFSLITATLADSMAFIVVYDDRDNAHVLRLNSVMHNPQEEPDRIKRAGGVIRHGRINGQLALSRAIGDFMYNKEVVCADASIDIYSLQDIYQKLNLSQEQVKKVQIITTCDGFTEPLRQAQSKSDHETWLFDCLSDIAEPELQEEQQLAEALAIIAFEKLSQDNISIAVQTLVESQPFLTGIYDGHAGADMSTLTASSIGAMFQYQCSLGQETYAEQDFSANNHFVTYYRDNKNQAWYLPLVYELTNARVAQLDKPGGIKTQLDLLRTKSIPELGSAIQEFCHFMDILCQQYTSLALTDKEFSDCGLFVIEPIHVLRFYPNRYSSICLDFKKYQTCAKIIINEDNLTPIIMHLKQAFQAILPTGIVTNAIQAGYNLFSSMPITDALPIDLDFSP